MTGTAAEVLADAVRRLTPEASANPLLPRLVSGEAPRRVLAALALEQHHIVVADRRSFAHLALRCAGRPHLAAFFGFLARGEGVALERLDALVAACGLDAEAVRAYEPLAGCQAYPAYAAWLALGAEPVDVVVALNANFAAWGGYCASIARALRELYGLGDDACGFFDFFAEPAPELPELSLRAVQEGMDAGLFTERPALRYGRLLQEYEAMFWRTLATS
ncbi:transcriptional regulator [Streptomyces gamaensis]|uniref:Transcriptional regulator n=1 Tax=Streptomyces gamaensis TaxID=1763542 RepID=A0ABW0YWP3_9ACTN